MLPLLADMISKAFEISFRFSSILQKRTSTFKNKEKNKKRKKRENF
jgi:hypothetical protein